MNEHSTDIPVIRTWSLDKGAGTALPSDIKPILTATQQVALLKTKGVSFKRCSEKAAIETLSTYESFIHLTSYRKLFQKHTDGPNAGKYVRLDFADLVRLDELDNQIRRTFLLIANDIERAAKTNLLTQLSRAENEDGYAVVADFIASQNKSYRRAIEHNLKNRAKSDAYSGNLIEHYRNAMPAWVLMEVVPFGTQLAFMLFCAERWGDKELADRHFELTRVKSIRNCCSHLSCIINGFTSHDKAEYPVKHAVGQWLDDRGIKATHSRKSKLSNARMQQLVTALKVYSTLEGAPSQTVSEEFKNLSNSLHRYEEMFGSQNAFVSYLAFLSRVIDSI